MKPRTSKLDVRQVNVFYNYAIGLTVTDVDLIQTSVKLLKSGLARTVCFSDLKFLYFDNKGKIQLEWLRPEGRQWDFEWAVKFEKTLPRTLVEELTFSVELAFHEQHIEGIETNQKAPYLRTALPPLVLEKGELTLPIYSWLKVFSDGIAILSFQLDTSWEGLDEAGFISDVINLYQQYFERVWVNADIQRLDAERILPDAFVNDISIAGQEVVGRQSKKLLKEMRSKSQSILIDALSKSGKEFDIGEETWCLHQIAGSEGEAKWEATIDLCRSLYINAMTGLFVPGRARGSESLEVQLWQGRPSVSLMRFRDQPPSKNLLLTQFGPAMSRMLMRSPSIAKPPELPPDLRLFEDYCFHANRSILLWTWLKSTDGPEDAWKDSTTRGNLLENQGRAEHFEYHNMKIARACAIAQSPPSDEQLVVAYETLASSDSVIHHSSHSGEITDALAYLLLVAGTTGLVASSKEQARWHLDERRYRTEKNRSRIDRWLAFVFGLVGAAGLADLVIHPSIEAFFPDLHDGLSGLLSFIAAILLVSLVASAIWITNRFKNQ